MAVASSGIARAAVLMSVLAALSALLGLARDIVIAARFGAGSELDAYLVGQGLVSLVLGLLAGAMAKATVPVVARGVSSGAVADAHRAAVVVLSVTTVVMAVASIVMWLAVGPVIGTFAPGFDRAQQELAGRLTRVVLLATVFIAGTNLLAAVAQAHRRFFWSGFQGIPFNAAMIVAAAVFGPRFGIMSLAVGFVIGSGLRFVAQLVPLKAIGFRLKASFDLTEPGFREVTRLLPALLVGSAVSNVNLLVDRAVGSGSAEGTISALNYGWRVAAFADMLLIGPLVTSLYPALGAATDGGDLRRLVQRGLSTMAIVLAPVATVMCVAAAPAVAVVFGRGSFDASDVERTATALAWYAPALLALGWRDVVSRAFYSRGDARTPVVVAIGAMVINVIGDVTMGRRYGVAGLAGSTTLSMIAAAVVGTSLLARRHRAVDVRATVAMVGRILGASLVGAVLALTVLQGVGPEGTPFGWAAVYGLAIGAAGVFAGYAGVLVVARAPELRLLATAMGQLAPRVWHVRRRRRGGGDR